MILDLSHELYMGMPVYPGDKEPELKTLTFQDDLQITELKINVHTGTHIDIPLHYFKDREPIETFDLDKCYGNAVVIDCSSITDKQITFEILKKYETADFLLFYTGWDKFWGSYNYFQGYPVMN
ncbi:MAG: cyclase family protein, partial [Bacteroidales bacterium]|nr:cyclase family protein [Bacteroidales bacterium]